MIRIKSQDYKVTQIYSNKSVTTLQRPTALSTCDVVVVVAVVVAAQYSQ